jgi:DNA-binding FrmR family transcriptional regulator
MTEAETKLVHRLNRIQGQIEAIKSSIGKKDQDCEQAINLLKAANQAMKNFGEAYIHEYLETCLREKKSVQSLQPEIRRAISAAFRF